MSEAIKTGDKVTINGGDGDPVEVIDVVTLYYVNTYPTSIALRESQIRPYVRPLAVGDRVRACASGCQGVIIATHKNEFWVDRGERYGCVTYHADELERIPTEEAGK